MTDREWDDLLLCIDYYVMGEVDLFLQGQKFNDVGSFCFSKNDGWLNYAKYLGARR